MKHSYPFQSGIATASAVSLWCLNPHVVLSTLAFLRSSLLASAIRYSRLEWVSAAGLRGLTRIACVLGLALTSLTAFRPAMAAVPSLLPDELQRPAGGKMVLLDFYSAYCGACQMMEPHLQLLATRTQPYLYIERIDLGETDNEKYLSQFEIQGTPTYILYDGKGQILYQMKNMIAPLVLERQVLRLTGRLKKTRFPAEVSLPDSHPIRAQQDASDALGQMILIAFESPQCEPCREMTPYLEGFEISGQNGLHVLRADTATPAGKKLMNALSIRSLPAYVLFDNNQPLENTLSDAGKTQPETKPDEKASKNRRTDSAQKERGELFRVTGKVSPQVLWRMIRMFGDAGV